jgi:hydroxyacylglutathione hydrolase
MSSNSYIVETFPVGLFQCNCSILTRADQNNLCVIDPGDEFDLIQERIEFINKPVSFIWHTHAHLDHVGATKLLSEWASLWNKNFDAPPPQIYLHEEDRWLYENISIQATTLGLPSFEVTKTFERIKDSQTYADFPELKALHTPGHTPGSCCMSLATKAEISMASQLWKSSQDSESQVLFSGDTLFRRSIGRTDLWGGDGKKILNSISRKLMSLPENTLVIPGHGPVTTIEEEKEHNPFL